MKQQRKNQSWRKVVKIWSCSSVCRVNAPLNIPNPQKILCLHRTSCDVGDLADKVVSQHRNSAVRSRLFPPKRRTYVANVVYRSFFYTIKRESGYLIPNWDLYYSEESCKIMVDNLKLSIILWEGKLRSTIKPTTKEGWQWWEKARFNMM